MKIECYENSTAFDLLQAEWNPLVQRSATNVPFLTREWQQAWWLAFGVGKELRLLALRDDEQCVQALLPLFVQDTVLEANAPLPRISIERPEPPAAGQTVRALYLLGGTEVSDYLDMLAPPELQRAAWAACLEALAQRADWQMLDLHNLPAASPSLAAVDKLSRERAWSVQQAREEVCPVIELPATWDDYLTQTLNKKQRHELRRKMRKAEQETHVEWHWAERAEQLGADLETFIRLHRASHPDKEAFMDAHMQGFFRTTARLAFEQGWLRLSVLSFNQQPVASYLCFDWAGSRMVYNSGFDLATYADLAPGIVLVGYMIEDAIQHGLKRFDFMRGGERYKFEFGPVETEVRRMLVRR